jgi:hypothetical protein
MKISYVFVAALALIHATNATVNLDWKIQSYEPITVDINEDVIFTFSSAHDVVEST